MTEWELENLKALRTNYKTYRAMIEYCGDDLILNNDIMKELTGDGYYFELDSGDDMYYLNSEGDYITREEYEERLENGEDVREEFEDIYQYFIISARTAEYLARYTNELIYYCERLDLYLLAVTHFGTSWDGVPANWKDPEEEAKRGLDDDN